MEDAQTTSQATEEQTPAAEDAPTGSPGFSERGRMRRRIRFLRKARELAYRDLGGLVFDLHRFGRRNDELVLAKLETVGRIDGELRTLESILSEHRPVTVLHEAGVAACPRCAAIHGSDDRFCPNCGLAMDLRAERPMAGPPAAAAGPAPTPVATSPPATAPVSVPAPTSAPSQAPVSAPTTAAPAPLPATAAPGTTSTPAPASGMPSTPASRPPAPSPNTTPPAGPAPTPGGGGSTEADAPRPNVDQPTEIVRPPAQDP
jgi:hypothetical protein